MEAEAVSEGRLALSALSRQRLATFVIFRRYACRLKAATACNHDRACHRLNFLPSWPEGAVPHQGSTQRLIYMHEAAASQWLGCARSPCHALNEEDGRTSQVLSLLYCFRTLAHDQES